MKENYKAWAIDFDEFFKKTTDTERTRFFLSFVLLAPSGHNSQPWKFKIKDNIADIFFEKERLVTASDEEGRQTFVALGCLITNFSETVKAYGYTPIIKYNKDLSITNTSSLVQLSFIKESKNIQPNLVVLKSMTDRHTDRNKYNQKEFPDQLLKYISQLSDDSFLVSTVSDTIKRKILASYAVDAQIDIMEKFSFRNELSHFIKNTLSSSKYGMTGNTLCLPLFVSFFASKLISKINLSKITKKKDFSLLYKSTPSFLFISSKEDTPLAWIKSGELLENIWLESTKHLISCHPLAAIIQNKSFRQKLSEELKTDFYPNIFIRIGYSKANFFKIPSSPRFLVSDLII
ncbi:MAG: hypothetical protein WC870_00620 [Candidatus Paceibacterota bacterium]